MSSAPSNWSRAWESYVSQFRSAIQSNSSDSDLRNLLAECLNIYSASLSVSTIDETLAVISGYRCSPLEIAFMWMGRWRPTTAVVLVYSTMGVDFEGTVKETQKMSQHVHETILLSKTQLSGLSALQKHAHQTEADLSQQLATLQMLLVEQNTVTALHLGEDDTGVRDLSRFRQVIDMKLAQMQTLLVKADELRLQTLRSLFDLLTPIQAASCSVAAYELVFSLKSLGKTLQNSGSSRGII